MYYLTLLHLKESPKQFFQVVSLFNKSSSSSIYSKHASHYVALVALHLQLIISFCV